jgi:hypothetical protein
MTGINGYLKIANSHPEYDGMELKTEYAEKGIPLFCECKIHRKDRKYPAIGVAHFSEVAQNTPIWKLDMRTQHTFLAVF